MEKNRKLEIEALVEFATAPQTSEIKSLVEYATALQTLARTLHESLDIYVNRLQNCQVFDDERELQEACKAAKSLAGMSDRITCYARKLALEIQMQKLEYLRRKG